MLQTMRAASSVCISCLGRQSDQPTWDQYCSVSAKRKWSWSVMLKAVNGYEREQRPNSNCPSCSFLPIPQQIKPHQYLFREGKRASNPNLEVGLKPTRTHRDERENRRDPREA